MAQTIKVASVSKSINEVEFFLNAVFKENQFSRKIYCRMYLCITEAFNNSILHGNQHDPDKMVTIIFDQNDEQYFFTVCDEGAGFNMHVVPDPTHHSNLRKESGRGIFIMKEYADKVIFANNGSEVKLIFNK
jgi:serine/threonine-protein kinase RsbW